MQKGAIIKGILDYVIITFFKIKKHPFVIIHKNLLITDKLVRDIYECMQARRHTCSLSIHSRIRHKFIRTYRIINAHLIHD